jgi:membrane-bound lytic murein transglycosylase MltF
MDIQLNDDGSFQVKLSSEEWNSLKELQEMFKDCSEKFDEKVSLEETLKEVIEAGFCWLS